MVIDDKLLNKLEKLSSLELSSEKKEEFKKQLGHIIDFVKKLEDLDLSKVKGNDIPFTTPLREDEPKCDKEVIDIILKHAPRSEDHFFVVPKIIE